MDQPPHHSARYRRFVRFSGYAAVLVAVTVIVDWIIGTGAFTFRLPAHARIDPDAGAGLGLAGISLLLQHGRWKTRQLAGQIAAVATIAVGALTLAYYAGGWNAGLVPPSLADGYPLPDDRHPGRMSLVSALVFVLLGSAQLLLARKARAGWIEGLILLAGINALIPLIGYLYGKSALYDIRFYGMESLPLALALLMICAGILAARPRRGIMALISSGGTGGITARRLLPAALLLPLLVERLQSWGHQAGWYDATFGIILATLASMLIFTVLILWNVKLLMRLDERRDEAEKKAHQARDALESNLHALTLSHAKLSSETCERRAAEDKLFHEHERAQLTLNSIVDGVITTDTEGRITYMNPAAESLTGWRGEEAAGKPVGLVFRVADPATRQPLAYSIDPAFQTQTRSRRPQHSLLVRRDGSEAAVNDSCTPIHDRTGKAIGAMLVLHDVSALQAMTHKMSYLSRHDSLTGLPNRFLLSDRLAQALGLSVRHGTRSALMFLDLDRFKHVNDTLGHDIGDRLLQEIAARLLRCMRDSDTVSRHGGDEFVILLPEVSDSIGAARIAGQLLATIAEPFFIDGHELHITASIGISVCPEDGQDAETIVKHAESAMYQAKAHGRNNYQFFMRRINERAIHRFALEGSLRRAIAREEPELYFQPKLGIADAKVTGAEALIRWHDEGRGTVPPDQFIPIAEESGLIIPIGEWVLQQACRQNRAWQDAGYEPMTVAVNVSAVQFRERNFLKMVERALAESGLDPRYLELELTESATMHDMEMTISLLKALKRMGVSLSIDDFGTGYSSFSYLKRFPIDTLKIDRSFVQDVTTDPDDAAITCAIIGMAKRLKQHVIAEGVENAGQFEFLRREGCEAIQGYYFSGPLAPREFERRILLGAAALT